MHYTVASKVSSSSPREMHLTNYHRWSFGSRSIPYKSYFSVISVFTFSHRRWQRRTRTTFSVFCISLVQYCK